MATQDSKEALTPMQIARLKEHWNYYAYIVRNQDKEGFDEKNARKFLENMRAALLHYDKVYWFDPRFDSKEYMKSIQPFISSNPSLS